jgi:hypothetical protein
VRLPKAELAKVTEGGKAVNTGDGIVKVRQDGDSVVVDVGSGKYQFAYPMSQAAQATAGTATASISGKWRFVFNTEGGEREATPAFEQHGDKLTGKWNQTDVQGTFVEGHLDLSFPYYSEEAATSGTLKIKGRAEGDGLKGTWEFADYSGTFAATRVK